MSEAAIKFNPGKRFGDWTISKKIDEGGFGQVYFVTNRKTKERAALKAESNEVEGGSAIKLEIQVLQMLNSDGEKPHIPVVHHAAKHKAYCYMIMTLLGDNFKALKMQYGKAGDPPTLSVSTWTRLAVQCLYALKLLHDYGFVHRDIKPNNFVMGHNEDPERCRSVFILDFGLSRSYAFKVKGGRWVARLARGTAEFRGTVRYCSPYVHDKLEQGRRDDVWSLFYVLIELHCGLPWQTTREKEVIEVKKCHMKDDVLTMFFPRELRSIIPELRKLDCYQRPDYLGVYNALLSVMKRYNVKNDDPYDWDPDNKLNEKRRIAQPKPKKTPAWYNATEFFAADPINIHKAPRGEDKELIRKIQQQASFTIDKKEDTKEQEQEP